MKKFILLFALISFTILSSCSGEDGAPGRDGKNGQDALISEVFELQNVNFGNTGNGYQIFQNLNPNIYASDVILMYLKTDVLTNGSPVWSSIPRTFTTNLGTVNYDFDFSKQDFTIYAGGTYNLSLTPAYITNQTFRIVIVPGAFSNRLRKEMSYEEVIAKYNINDKNVKVLN